MSNKTSLRSETSTVRYLGASRGKSTQHALTMRLTAAALIPLTLLFAFLVVSLIGRDYDSVLRLFSHRIGPGTIAFLFVTVGIYHMKAGMETIIEDYAHGRWKSACWWPICSSAASSPPRPLWRSSNSPSAADRGISHG